MNIKLTQEQVEALAVMVSLGEQDRTNYLDRYGAENEETPEQIEAGHRQVEVAHDAMAAILKAKPSSDVESELHGDQKQTGLITVSADFHVGSGDPEDLRGPIERAVADLLEDSSNDGAFSIPGESASFLSAEVTAVYGPAVE
jgi:hypothetical protein